MAKKLAAAGWAVVVNHATDAERVAPVVDNIAATGGQACAAPFSSVEAEALPPGLDAIARDLGLVDLIVDNATGPQPEMPLMNQSWRTSLDQLEFLVKAPLELLQYVLPE